MEAITTANGAEADCRQIIGQLRETGLWHIPGETETRERAFRVSPTPFVLPPDVVDFVNRLGPALYKFYRAANTLYLRKQHPWVNEYLDMGKPESLVEHAHMNYHKGRIPAVIRPDILITPEGFFVTELDSVPGGIGLTAKMSREYAKLGYELIGGANGMVEGFADAVMPSPEAVLAIVVSEESESYRTEMEWLALAIREMGRRAYCVRPEELIFTEDGLFIEIEGERLKIDVLYRFFELFDLKNIQKSELIAYAAKKRRVIVTPPYKHFLEEKSLLALFHHPMLGTFWRKELGEEYFELLQAAIPNTWIMDSRPIPPHALIPDFAFRGEPVNDWRVIREGTQKERRLIIKPSGFSALAWGSHGVVAGHDVSAEEWAAAVDRALESFGRLPYVLQHFREGTKFQVEYFEETSVEMREFQGRVRLSPYYFVSGESAELSGALATICPLDKKLIHGMVDAVMVPSAAGEVTGDA